MGWLFFLGWLLCGVGGTGIFVAHFQRKFPTLAKEGYRSSLGAGLLFGLFFGPLFLITAFFMSGLCEYGWTLSPPKE